MFSGIVQGIGRVTKVTKKEGNLAIAVSYTHLRAHET